MRWQWSPFASLQLHELYALLRLRVEVFVVEQDCPYQDLDGLDAKAMHLLGWQGDELVAYLRAFGPGDYFEHIAIGRVVTAPSVRGTGLGRPLMREGMRCAHEQFGRGSVHLSAQAHLSDYYGSLGYRVVGPGYLEDGIPHLPMRWSPDEGDQASG